MKQLSLVLLALTITSVTSAQTARFTAYECYAYDENGEQMESNEDMNLTITLTNDKLVIEDFMSFRFYGRIIREDKITVSQMAKPSDNTLPDCKITRIIYGDKKHATIKVIWNNLTLRYGCMINR